MVNKQSNMTDILAREIKIINQELRRKSMDFHYELLEETRKEIKNIRFFREDVEINAEEYEVIHDYDEAYENAFDREYEELEGQMWVDILEDEMGEVHGIIYEHDNYAELNKIVHGIEIPELDDIEFPIDDISVEQEMYSEIELCAKSRFICGKGNAFFESLFKAYILGGWPCGWKNGKIIVYVPANNAHVR